MSGLAVAYNRNLTKYQGPYPTLLKIDLVSHTVTAAYDDGKTLITVRTTDGFEVHVHAAFQTVYII